MSKWIGMAIAPGVTGRSLLESPSTQVRSLEGRPLGMSSSLMLPEFSRLRLLELESGFVTASAEQRHPMPRWTLQNRGGLNRSTQQTGRTLRMVSSSPTSVEGDC
jgi:hypothetical protein